MKPKFRYTLTYQSIDYVLEYAPIGWDTDMIGSVSRSKDKFGITRKFSLPLRFVKDGYAIIKEAIRNGGYEVGVRLHVERRTRLWGYETVYLGDLDFSEYDDDGVSISLPVMEQGITAEINAKEGTTFEFELTGNDVVNIVIPGVKFNDRLLFLFTPTDTSQLNSSKKYQPDIDLITQSASGFIEGFNQPQRNWNSGDNLSQNVFLRNQRPNVMRVVLNGFIKGFVANWGSPTSSITADMAISQTSDNSAIFIPFFFGGNWGNGEARAFSATLNNIIVDLQPGEGLYSYIRTNVSSTGVTSVIQEGEIAVTYETVSDPSNCKGIRPFDLFKRIMSRVSPSAVVNSALLTSTWKNLIITSGSAIRELPDAKIKISLKDFYQGFRGIDDVGMGSENGQFRMETLDFFFRNVPIFDVGNVDKCNTTVATDWIYSKLNIGYKNKTTDEPDGREGFNAEQEWQFPISRITNDMPLVSTFIADQYEIEKMRVQFNVKKEATSDSNSDNDTFVVHCKDIDNLGNFYPILGSDLQDVTGLTSGLTSYNLLISPKRNLLRHGRYFASMLDLLEARYVEFASAEKNANISTTDNGQIVIENKDIRVNDLGIKLFRPYIFKINAALPTDAMKRIDANPFATIRFNYNGVNCSGFMLEAGVDLGSNSAQELTLLCAPDGFLP